LALFGDRQRMFLLDHFFALDLVYAPERDCQKIVLHGELSDLGVEFFNIRFSGEFSLIEDL
jgi:hypothetical protein